SESSVVSRQLSVAGLWLDGFAALSPQELDLLAALMPHCEQATLAFCLDPKSQKGSWLSHWSVVRKTVEQCRGKLSALPGVSIAEIPMSVERTKSRFVTPTLARLEESWSKGETTEHGTRNTEHDSLRLVTCTNPDAEAIFAAREILKFVRAK